jgi:adenylate kinase family enzyme
MIILVGESGSGKTTFVEMMDCQDNWFESSRAMVEALLKKGEPVTHNTIHSFANRAYKEDPCWQVPNILGALAGKIFLLFDGPRRIEEVKAVIAMHPRVLVVRIAISSNELRFNRLQKRDEIGQEDFYRLLIHEAGETELMQIVSLADFTIFNNGSLEDIKKQASELKETLLSIDNFLQV